MPFDDALRRKLSQFSVRPAGGTASGKVESIVLAQIGDPLEEAFAIARERLNAGDAVRLIGPGVTLQRTWPAWVRDARDLTLTEWGAFCVTSQREATRDVQDELRAWIRSKAGADFGGAPTDRILFASACARFFQQIVIAFPVARAIARTFPGGIVRGVATKGLTVELLHQFLRTSGGKVIGIAEASPRKVPWRLELLATGAAGIAVSVVDVARAYLRAAPSFRALRKLRATRAGVDRATNADAPETWVGMVSDWYRANHQLIDSFALPETARGGALGILIVGSLAPFQRDEENMRKHHASDLWPGLGKLRERFSQCMVEQAVMPEAPLAFAQALAKGVGRSASILWRASSSARIVLPSVSASPSARGVASWATIDVIRATLAEAATAELLARLAADRITMRGKTLVMVSSGNASLAPVDLALQRAGATTVEHVHGLGGDNWSGVASTASSIRSVWTLHDAQSAAVPGLRLLVSGMTVRLRIPPRARRATNVLIMTNYVHRDSLDEFGFPSDDPRANRFPLGLFQTEVLDVVRLLRERGHMDLVFRWRPHPADNSAEIRRAHAGLVDVELSQGRPIEADVAWADVAVSTNSTVIGDALFSGIPLFVHPLPELWGIPAMSFIDQERMFFHAADGARRISEWLGAHASDPGAGLEPECRARARLFGPSREPIPMTAYFGASKSRSLDLVEPATPLTSARDVSIPLTD